MNPLFMDPSYGQLPPIQNQQIQQNPLSGEHLFFQNSVGQMGGVDDFGQYTEMNGNPLYYGQTGDYSGPSGATEITAPTQEIVTPAPEAGGLSLADVMRAQNGINQTLSRTNVQGGSSSTPYDLMNFLEAAEGGGFNIGGNAAPSNPGMGGGKGMTGQSWNQMDDQARLANLTARLNNEAAVAGR